MSSHGTQLNGMQQLSKPAFIKIFLDLTDKGFLKSESETDILSVNNKIALGFRKEDLVDIVRQKLSSLDLPEVIKLWVKHDWGSIRKWVY